MKFPSFSRVAALLIALSTSSVFAAHPPTSAPETIIWMNAPAKDFTESTPVGNGRLGAMMFGGVEEERLVLNESSVWSGSRQEADRLGAYKVLPEIRRLLIEGRNPEAEELVNANFTCEGPGSGGGRYGCYQVLGNLHLIFNTPGNSAPITDYRRELNLSDAVTQMHFNRGGVEFQREMFLSAPDEVMVLRLTANEPSDFFCGQAGSARALRNGRRREQWVAHDRPA